MGSTLFSVSSDSNGVFSSPFPSLVMEPTKQRGDFESGLFSKHGRSALGVEETDELNHLKVTKSDPMLIATRRMEPFHLWSNSCSLSSDGERMLSFSSPRSDAMAFSSCETLPCLWKAGMCHGRYNVGMHGTMGGFKGSFTPSQWMELEQQALIYKYIDAKIPVPSNLVIPIRTSLNPSGFPSFTAGSYRSGKWGYGSCNLAFAGNADPEPGRCRRTDGKKWRCSRDAVGDQKYCERHMNRGRHRSRKHVEGHNGHAAKAAMPTPSQLGPTVSGSLANHNLSGTHQQLCKSLQAGMAESSPTQFDRLLMIKGTSSELALNSQTASVQTNFCPEASDAFPIFKQQTFYEGTSIRPEASLSSSDSLFCVPKPEIHDDQPKPHPLLHFIDDWPKTHSEHPSMAWSDIEEMHTERTRLSISTPVGSSQHSSSSSSPNKHKLALSPISLPHDNRHPSWMPISWDPMLGGPLGEVLTNKSRIVENNSRHSSSSPLNLLADGWDLSPRVESSPTGVLQKACFVSLSSSTASSPRTVRQKAHEADEFGSTFVNPYD